VKRAVLFEIESWDVNCPQHIHKRFPQTIVAPVIEELRVKVSDLESKLAALQSQENRRMSRRNQSDACVQII
jgi:hypothetical protein